MTNMQRLIDGFITSVVMVSGTFGIIAAATWLLGDQCWPTRFGGLLVGISVFIQGYVYANHDAFSKVSKHGLTREQRVLHKVYLVTLFGTLLWAFGDFIPSVYGIPTCQASQGA